MTSKNHLIIISIPFARLVRLLLSTPILDVLKGQAKVLVVSPFSNNNFFKNEFSSNHIKFFKLKNESKTPKLCNSLYISSEILRRHGYWVKYRKSAMRFYAMTRFVSYGADGDDQKFSILKKCIYYILSILGIWKNSWKIVDTLIGPFIFQNNGLEELTEPYDKVTLVQSASWGIQDRTLSWLAKKNKWRTVLIPYTTDQLTLNGYLLSEYDAVCVQGTCDKHFVEKYHNLPKVRIEKLGSPWSRYLKLIKDSEKHKENDTEKRKIIYAGISSIYFPMEAEFHGLEIILEAINNNEIDNYEVIYRPVALDHEAIQKIHERFSNRENLTIEFAQSSFLAMDEYKFDRKTIDDVKQFVTSLDNCDLVITALDSSICIEAAFLGIPSIAFYYDKTGVLERRKTLKLFLQNGKIQFMKHIPVISNSLDLIPEIKKLLNNEIDRSTQTNATCKEWDYEFSDFESILKRALGI